MKRRDDQNQWTAAEKCISEAMSEVELMGAHPKLTDAITKLGDARNDVADFVELYETTIPECSPERDERPERDESRPIFTVVRNEGKVPLQMRVDGRMSQLNPGEQVVSIDGLQMTEHQLMFQAQRAVRKQGDQTVDEVVTHVVSIPIPVPGLIIESIQPSPQPNDPEQTED